MKSIKLIASILAISALAACDDPARSDRNSIAEPTPGMTPATPGTVAEPGLGGAAPATDPTLTQPGTGVGTGTGTGGTGIGGDTRGTAAPSPSPTPSTL
jgi:hypothetical protein